VISIVARASTIQTFGNTTTIPFYDALYLGGPNDLRGFQYRFVSPVDIYGEPIGGKTSAMSTLEYSFDIVSPVRFALFYDVGFVNPGTWDFSPYNYNDDFGVGLRLTVLGSPLSLDYGIPLRGSLYYPNKQGNQFNFSFGTRF
jgi:outer membrane protein insertion porin family